MAQSQRRQQFHQQRSRQLRIQRQDARAALQEGQPRQQSIGLVVSAKQHAIAVANALGVLGTHQAQRVQTGDRVRGQPGGDSRQLRQAKARLNG